MTSPFFKQITQYKALLIGVLCLIIALLAQLLFYRQYGADPMGVFTRQTRTMLSWGRAGRKSMEFLDSGFVLRLSSASQSVTGEQLKKQVANLVVARQRKLDSLSLIPEQALLMVDWADLAAATRGFFTSRLGRQVHSIDWPGIMKKIDVPPQMRRQLNERVSGAITFVESPLFRGVFSGRMVLALLPAARNEIQKQQGDPQARPSKILAGNLMVILNLRQEYLLRGVLSLLALGAQQKSFLYNGITVFEFTRKNNKKIYLYSVGKQLVVSLSQKPIQRSVDLYLHHLLYPNSGLHQNKEYKDLKKRTYLQNSQDDFFIYADLAAIKSQINSFAMQPQQNRKQSHTKMDFPGLQRLAFFHHAGKNVQDNIEQFTSIVQFDQGPPQSLLKTIFSRKTVLNRGLSKMPPNLLIYFWTNWLDLSGLWRGNYIRGMDDEGGMADEIATWIEKQTGLSINYFLSLFGDEFGFNVDQISSSGFVPVPRICLCLEIKDRDRVEQLIEQMIVDIPVKRGKVAGKPVVSFMIAKGLMQPSYAVLDRFLVIADGRDQIEALLMGKPELLVDDPPFKEVDTGMRQPSNMILFVHIERLNEELKEIALWLPTIIGIGNPKAGARSRLVVNQVVLPLLDGLKMYRAEGVRSYSAPGEVVSDMMLSVWPEQGTGQTGVDAAKPEIMNSKKSTAVKRREEL